MSKQRVAKPMSVGRRFTIGSHASRRVVMGGLGNLAASRTKRGLQTVSRTAEVPGQTVNVDLCFVPASHVAELKLPAVSGSSGRLVIERLADDGEAHDYPGRVFEDSALDYTQAMLAFAAASMNTLLEAPAPVTTAEG